MAKKLIIINGAMGVGKTATCRELNRTTADSVWLDGDWCWMMNPFIANEENKNMVIDNITHLLKNFLTNASLEYIIFNWVIHTEDIYKLILTPLQALNFEVIKITLTCSEEVLKQRIEKSSDLQRRDINKCLAYLKLYEKMSTQKIDTTTLSISQTVERIKELSGNKAAGQLWARKPLSLARHGKERQSTCILEPPL